jgi:hypothetical protein
MTETTNPLPDDPSGATAMPEESTLVNGSQELLDAGATGTDEGPGGIPAALTGVDKRGDEVDPPPAARGTQSYGPAETDDPLSPADPSSPQATSSGRGDAAASNDLPASREGR